MHPLTCRVCIACSV